MNRAVIRVILLVPCLALAIACSRGIEARGGPARPPGAVTPSAEARIIKVTTLKEYGKSLDWSHEKNLIAFGKLGSDRYFDVFVMKPDGSEERCITCGGAGVPQKHNGNPSWHPSGDYLVFTAEKGAVPRWLDRWAIPGTGINCDLWVATSDGSRFTKLMDLPLRQGRNQRATIHPQFSHDGKKLLWAERIGGGNGSWGKWVLKTANFIVSEGSPHLEDIQTHQPAPGVFYESHSFSLDDRGILFSGNLESRHPENGLDIYQLDLESDRLTRLTSTLNDWDEHAHYSPGGKWIVWMSSRGLNIQWGDISGHTWKRQLKTELWIMDSDRSNPRRLTNFNQPGWYPEPLGSQVIVSDNAWSPDGKAIVATIAYGDATKSKIVMIELDEAG